MPDLSYELTIQHEKELRYIAGLDEAGRGALAGPVVAAAVILPINNLQTIDSLREVDDSKRLSAKKRERLFDLIIEKAVAFGIGICSAAVIDEIGIIPATKRGMETAVSQLSPAPQYLLVDGRLKLTAIPLPQQSIIRGDSHSLSIAAASILAKVTRDRLMIALDSQHPTYGFAQHKGYGTLFHRQAIAKYGATAVHRHTFRPIRKEISD